MFSRGRDYTKSELERLIQGCRDRQRSCQKQIYDLYAPKMLILCLRYCDNQQEAEEVLQDGFLQVFKYIYQFKGAGTFEGWTRKIMINCALMRYRSIGNMHRIVSLTEDLQYLPAENDFMDRLTEKELINLIQKLPPAYRMVFNLYVFEGLKHKEIARLLNITEGTSKSNLSDARTHLKRSLANNYKVAK
jgi:RNA polymerase sigma-70 factor (ECF subfamily)